MELDICTAHYVKQPKHTFPFAVTLPQNHIRGVSMQCAALQEILCILPSSLMYAHSTLQVERPTK